MGTVTDHQWAEFLRTEVTPRFPKGITVIAGSGQWLSKNNVVVREVSRVLEIVHEDSADERARIEEIADNYRKRFAQEAVMIIRTPVEACLLN